MVPYHPPLSCDLFDEFEPQCRYSVIWLYQNWVISQTIQLEITALLGSIVCTNPVGPKAGGPLVRKGAAQTILERSSGTSGVSNWDVCEVREPSLHVTISSPSTLFVKPRLGQPRMLDNLLRRLIKK